MILVPYDEPEDQAWREWRDTGIARHGSMKEHFAFGHKPDIDERLYKAMRSLLMQRFHDKCAYCETPILRYTVDVEHYRPKGRVTDANRNIIKVTYMGREYDHPGYFWHVYDWKNLLPSCEFCNRRRYHEAHDATWGKETCFPVEQDRYAWPWDSNDQEKPLLIHPRLDDPNEHLMFIRGISGETGNIFCCVQHKDVRGETTIRVLGLNDERLNGPRLDAYAEAYNKMGEVFDWIKLLRDAPSDAVRSSLRRTKEDVNRIWHGEKSYTAFGRLGILDYRAHLEEEVGIAIPLPPLRVD
jgi:uncharacterized protein (TIGR02646 family)